MPNIAQRKFGIEVECTGLRMHDAIAAIRAVGVECFDMGYDHTTVSHWKTVTDASVPNGFELVSPPLIGKDGLAEVEKVLTAITAAGARVDRRCGFHVHVEAADMSVEDIVRVATRYRKYERKIDAIMPASRRGNSNDFCQSMDVFFNYYSTAIARSNSPRQLANNCDNRYFKVNVAAWSRYKTIEFRHHSGTTNATKAVNWIVFCVTLVESTKRKADAAAAVEASVEACSRDLMLTAPAAEATRKLIAMFSGVGCTLETAAGVLGVSVSTVNTYLSCRIKRLGYVVTKDRATNVVTIQPGAEGIGRINIGRAARASAATTAQNAEDPLNVDPFTVLDPDVLGYYAERAADFGMEFA